MITARKRKILLCAKKLFLQYGYQKVSLSEIAKCADISRPTLYSIFGNKQSIFRAVVQSLQTHALNRIASIAPEKDLRKPLERAIDIWLIEYRLTLDTSPFSQELREPCFLFCQDIVDQGYQAFETHITRLLRSHHFHLSPEHLARLLRHCLLGLRNQDLSPSCLKALSNTLIELIIFSKKD